MPGSDDFHNKLSGSKDIYAGLVESLPVLVYCAEPQPPYSTIYVSPGIKMFGYSAEEWREIPDFWSKIIYPDDYARVMDETKSALNDGRETEYEYRLVAKNGSVHWVHDRGCFIFDVRGELLYWQGVILDITDKKRAEEELRLSEERFRSAMNYASIGKALVAPDGRWIQVNRALCRLIGYSEKELLVTNFQSITHPDDLAGDMEYVRQLLSGEIETYQIEKRYFHKSGQIVWGLLSVSLVRDLQGLPLYFISQIQDITKRKQAEQGLRESQEQYKQMVEHASDIIYKTDIAGNFTFVNPTIIKILKYTEEEFLKRRYLDMIHPDFHQKVQRFYARQLKKKIPDTYLDFIALTKDGNQVWLEQYAQLLIKEDQVNGFQAIARDITKRKQTEDELRNLSLHDELTGLYNRRGFLALAEHQLNLAVNKRIEKKLLVIYVDLDGLKEINDTYGHDEGSRAIIKTAEILKRSFRHSDLIARLSGDEFVVLAIEANEENTEMIALRLQEELKKNNQIENCQYELSFSFGIARFETESAFHIENLMKRADQEMYRQKRSKKSGY